MLWMENKNEKQFTIEGTQTLLDVVENKIAHITSPNTIRNTKQKISIKNIPESIVAISNQLSDHEIGLMINVMHRKVN